ncbi:unnamed protein product [Cuscuta campestris]|uniref:Uncharacterized protein n=1 Tax=Cuscuta campestris TaxID=132261 RepID=A0A484LRR0_9ASTE|nr:unnamed protein product [Cuscuta campestris]
MNSGQILSLKIYRTSYTSHFLVSNRIAKTFHFCLFRCEVGRRGNVQAQRNWPRLVRSMLAPDDLPSLIAASVVSVTPLEGNCQ